MLIILKFVIHEEDFTNFGYKNRFVCLAKKTIRGVKKILQKAEPPLPISKVCLQ